MRIIVFNKADKELSKITNEIKAMGNKIKFFIVNILATSINPAFLPNAKKYKTKTTYTDVA